MKDNEANPILLTNEILQNRRVLRVYPKPGLIGFEKNATQNVDSVGAGDSTDSQHKALMLDLVEEFGKETSIHGLNHVFTRTESKIRRLAWTFCFLIALGSLTYLSVYLARRYNTRNFKTTVESTGSPIYKIPFPEITICNMNRLNWSRLEVAKDRFLQPQHRHNEYEKLFTDVVALFDTLTIGQLERFDQFEPDSLAPLNYINFTSVVGLLSWRCDELLADCSWSQKKLNCCDIFIPRYSQSGLCWAFNSIESEQGAVKQRLDSKWPWHTSTPGAGNGLTVKALINERDHSPFSRNERKGISFMASQQKVWYRFPADVSSNIRAKVRFKAIFSFFSNDTRNFPPRVRHCLFGDERDSEDFKTLEGHEYMVENCQAECQQEHFMRYCNCTIDLFFPPGPYPVCKLVDLPCVAKYSHNVEHFEVDGEEKYVATKMRGIVCQCLLNCRSLRYVMDTHTRVLRPSERLANNSMVDLDFYFVQNTITVYKTSLIYTWVDLMFSFGGIATLFLGCSLISVVELVYFFFVDMPRQVHQSLHNSEERAERTESAQLYDKSVDKLRKPKPRKALKY